VYALLLFAHSWLRWVVVVALVVTWVRAFSGLRSGRDWSAVDRRWSTAFVATLDAQVTVGLLLYFVFSPITPRSLEQLGAAIPHRAPRFFALEHITMMLVALVVAHVTSVRVRRAPDAPSRFRRAAWGYGITFLVLLSSIPWPWMLVARPWLRGF